MKDRKKRAPSGGNDDAWMDTLSDLLFLMITFFVLLISMSTLDAKALKKNFGFFNGALAALKFDKDLKMHDTIVSRIDPFASYMAARDVTFEVKPDTKELEASRKLIHEIAENMVKRDSAQKSIRTIKPLVEASGGAFILQKREKDISFVLSHRLVFRNGTAEIDEKGRQVLKDMATIVKVWNGRVDIEAVSSWTRGPLMLTAIVEYLEEQWLDGSKLYPKMYDGWKRQIRFYLKKRDI